MDPVTLGLFPLALAVLSDGEPEEEPFGEAWKRMPLDVRFAEADRLRTLHGVPVLTSSERMSICLEEWFPVHHAVGISYKKLRPSKESEVSLWMEVVLFQLNRSSAHGIFLLRKKKVLESFLCPAGKTAVGWIKRDEDTEKKVRERAIDFATRMFLNALVSEWQFEGEYVGESHGILNPASYP